MKTMARSPACAAYAASDALVLPVDAHATARARCSAATRSYRPRSSTIDVRDAHVAVADVHRRSTALGRGVIGEGEDGRPRSADRATERACVERSALDVGKVRNERRAARL